MITESQSLPKENTVQGDENAAPAELTGLSTVPQSASNIYIYI